MERLTDRVRAQKLKDNADKLKAAGFAVSPDHELYIRLAEYENAEEEEMREREQWLKRKEHCKDCAHHTFHGIILFCNKHHVSMLYESGCNDFYPRKIYITQNEGE